MTNLFQNLFQMSGMPIKVVLDLKKSPFVQTFCNRNLPNIHNSFTLYLYMLIFVEYMYSFKIFFLSYQKFVQGKDLSRRSATDLDSIFGVRKGKKQGKKGDQEEKMEEPTSTVQSEVCVYLLLSSSIVKSMQ